MGDRTVSRNDPNSYSNSADCVVTNMHLNLKVDFFKCVLSGYVDLHVKRKNLKANLILDTRDLTIHSVKNQNTNQDMAHHFRYSNIHFGSALEVELTKTKAEKFVVRIQYETSQKASALQWLKPKQTAGKKHPYMFSQCQAIHARSIVPCQDTPGVKAPYTATITIPHELVALMSAIRDGEEISDDPTIKKCKFVQKIPIPSYLIAIAVGDLKSRKIGPRSHVWSEEEYVDKAAEEFSETDEMLSTAEKLLGEYVWGIYDLLLLPQSFPFGGMENPCLTFVTPTILAGDKSLVDVIAHEIAHSWTGNLVTNRNFEHFWLNEGFTRFVEFKIVGRMRGEHRRHFEALGGWSELEDTIRTLGEDNGYTKLIPDLTDVDPDDAFSSVPYEKGQAFLFYLETLLGGSEIFEKFLRDYINEFKYQSIDTDDWKSYLYEYFSDKVHILNKVDWNAWLNTPGMPPVKPKYDGSMAEKCANLCNAWLKADNNDLREFSSGDIEDMTSPQIIEFLSFLLEADPLPIKKLQKLNEVYEIGSSRNWEIRFRWIRLGLRSRWFDIIPQAVKFVTEQGRMKFLRPIYREMYSWDEAREIAISTYYENEEEMMYVTAYTIGKLDLKLPCNRVIMD